MSKNKSNKSVPTTAEILNTVIVPEVETVVLNTPEIVSETVENTETVTVESVPEVFVDEANNISDEDFQKILDNDNIKKDIVVSESMEAEVIPELNEGAIVSETPVFVKVIRRDTKERVVVDSNVETDYKEKYLHISGEEFTK